MDKNRKISCSSKSRHIVIKLFWVSDREKQEKISIKHHPIEKILADFFTKPVQGSKFKIFRTVVMGWNDVVMLWYN